MFRNIKQKINACLKKLLSVVKEANTVTILEIWKATYCEEKDDILFIVQSAGHPSFVKILLKEISSEKNFSMFDKEDQDLILWIQSLGDHMKKQVKYVRSIEDNENQILAIDINRENDTHAIVYKEQINGVKTISTKEANKISEDNALLNKFNKNDMRTIVEFATKDDLLLTEKEISELSVKIKKNKNVE